MEVWKTIPGYGGRYSISNLGNVKTADYRHKRYEHLMKLSNDKDGYLIITLWHDDSKTYSTERVHRLVASAFIPNIDNKDQIDHIDGNKKNNVVSNLRWCNSKENNNNPITLKRKSLAWTGENNPMFGKKSSKDTREKMSKAHKGKKHSKEWVQKCAIARHKKIDQFTRYGEFIRTWDSLKEAGEMLNISRSHISSCCSGSRKTAGNYIWKLNNKSNNN